MLLPTELGSQLLLIIITILSITFALSIIRDIAGLRRHLRALTITGTGLSLAISIYWCTIILTQHTTALPGTMLRADALTAFFCLLSTSVAVIVLIASKETTAVYCGSIILSTIGMILTAASNDIFLLYLSIELVTAPTIVLVAYHKTTERMEAALKYFIISIVASTLLLLGIGLLSAAAGSTNIQTITTVLPSATTYGTMTWSLFLLAGAAIIAGLGFKLGILPFATWIPDVYQGAPTEIAGLLAGGTKKAAYAAYLRLALILALISHWSLLLAILAALTMTIANIIAIQQQNLRRILAYSIISQAGFLVMGLACMTQAGYSATIIHTLTHAFMALGAFLVLGVFLSHKIETLEQCRGLGWRNPFLSASLTIFLLSLAGIPLLAGFVSKFLLITATVNAGLLWLAIFAILNSVLALYYYFKIIRSLYAYPGGGKPLPIRKGTLVAIICCLLLTIVVGIYPAPFIALASKAATAIFT